MKTLYELKFKHQVNSQLKKINYNSLSVIQAFFFMLVAKGINFECEKLMNLLHLRHFLSKKLKFLNSDFYHFIVL